MNGIEDYKAFLTKVSEEAGIPAFKPSEDGLVSMRVDDAYNVNFQFVEATGKVLCFIEVVQLPPDAPKAEPGTHATWCSFRRRRAKSSSERPVDETSENT